MGEKSPPTGPSQQALCVQSMFQGVAAESAVGTDTAARRGNGAFCRKIGQNDIVAGKER